VPLESESSIQNHTKVLVVGLVTKYSTKRGNAWTALWPCGEFDTSTFIAGYAFTDKKNVVNLNISYSTQIFFALIFIHCGFY